MSHAPFALQFPGQGSQMVGMGEALVDISSAAADVFAQADEVLGVPISQLCFSGPAEVLNDTVNTQPAILTVSVAALRALESILDGPPAFVAGHSLGEFTALVAAGALAFRDALLLVRERGRLMAQAGEQSPGGMMAVVGLDEAAIERVCAEVCEATGGVVAAVNYNCPGQVVVSGDDPSLKAAAEALEAAGARRVLRLPVSIAAHSPLMAHAAARFREALDRVDFCSPRVPVVANATARPLSDPDQIREVMARQLVSPVYWSRSVAWMIEHGARRFVEVGPKDVLTGMLRRIDRSVEGVTTDQVLAPAAGV